MGASSPGTQAAPHEQADFNGDDLPDLAIGVPGMVTGDDEQGAVVVLYGTASSGLSPTGNQLFTETTADVGAVPHGWDRFGWNLAVGDFDGYDDLAASAPEASVGAVSGSGVVIVLYGSADGLSSTGAQLLTQDNVGLLGTQTEGGVFGGALAVADLDGDGLAELTVGAPGEWSGRLQGVGAVHVLPGTTAGTTSVGTQVFHQGVPGIPGDIGAGTRFGVSLGAS